MEAAANLILQSFIDTLLKGINKALHGSAEICQILARCASCFSVLPLKVKQTVEHLIKAGLDGINFDLEEVAAPGSDMARAYTELVSLTVDMMRAVLPHSQVAFVASEPPAFVY